MKKIVFTMLVFALFNLSAYATSTYDSNTSTDQFPLYACIRPNVDFWLKIYTRYDVTEGVLHDNSNLSIIYGIIPLMDPNEPGASRVNEQRIKRVKEKYRGILTRLAQSPAPVTAEDERVIALFGEKVSPEQYLRASNQLRCQIGQKSRFLAGLIRSGAYLDEFRQIFVSQDLPGDLCYLAHVESSFDPQATSKCGAAGIWQFMTATARRFIAVNNVLDERRDPLIATRAAAAYLKENYELLDSWPLALTAYNHGASSMLRAKNQKGSYDRVFLEYRTPSFGFASRNFYPCFLAAREIAANHEKYFGQIELAKPMQTATLVMPGYASLMHLIRKLGVDIETIRELNPALRPSVYSGHHYVPKGYGLKIPAEVPVSSDVMLAQLPDDTFHNQPSRDRVHVVRKGETAFRIARMHHVGLSDLIAVNNLSRRAVIHPGQSLKIPASGVAAK